MSEHETNQPLVNATPYMSDVRTQGRHYKHLELEIFNDDTEKIADIDICGCQVDKFISDLLIELLYTRSKMKLMDDNGVENIHEQAKENTINLLDKIDAKMQDDSYIASYLDSKLQTEVDNEDA